MLFQIDTTEDFSVFMSDVTVLLILFQIEDTVLWIAFITEVMVPFMAFQAFGWGRDLIMGIVNGIRSAIGAVADAARSVADAIRSFLHFSVPDVGPLTDYESWMPDFMKGLAKGIEQSKGLVSAAMGDVAAGMTLNPMLAGAPAMGTANGGPESAGLTQQLLDALSGNGGAGGDICIPVYIGQDRIDEIVVTAAQRANYRSGGR